MSFAETRLFAAFGDAAHIASLNVRVTGTESKSNLSKDPAKVLEAHEKEKKTKYLKSCLEQRVLSLRSWSPLMA
jgi:hypothetical protein